MALAGCSRSSVGLPTGSNGAWTGCGNIDSVSQVIVTATPPDTNAHPPGTYLSGRYVQGRPQVAQALYLAACRLVALHIVLSGTSSCGELTGQKYEADFVRKVGGDAHLSYLVSGCGQVVLNVGKARGATVLAGPSVVTLETTFTGALAKALWVTTAQIYGGTSSGA